MATKFRFLPKNRYWVDMTVLIPGDNNVAVEEFNCRVELERFTRPEWRALFKSDPTMLDMENDGDEIAGAIRRAVKGWDKMPGVDGDIAFSREALNDALHVNCYLQAFWKMLLEQNKAPGKQAEEEEKNSDA